MNRFSGGQVVQVANPDPFARPVLRSPVLHTPGWLILAVQAVRLAWRLIRFAVRHPLADLAVIALLGSWRWLGWPGPLTLAVLAVTVCVTWRIRWPASWSRLIASPARGRWRRWHYQHRWPAVMVVAGLAVP